MVDETGIWVLVNMASMPGAPESQRPPANASGSRVAPRSGSRPRSPGKLRAHRAQQAKGLQVYDTCLPWDPNSRPAVSAWTLEALSKSRKCTSDSRGQGFGPGMEPGNGLYGMVWYGMIWYCMAE